MTGLTSYNIYPCLTPVRVASMSNIAGGTYYNGPSNNGVGAIFTCATGVLTIDSVIVNIGDYVLLGAQSLSYQNGIYEVMVAGNVGVSAVLQRRNDFQCIEQMKEGQYVSVGEGTVLAGAILTITGPLPSIVGQSGSSNSLTFINVASAGGGGGGTVSPGTANQISYYATTGSTVSGLTGAIDGVLVTDNTGIPSILANGTAGQVLTANTAAPPSWQAGGGGGVTAAQIQEQAFTYAVDTGTTDAFVVTLSPAPSSYTDGMYVCFNPYDGNSGTVYPTVNVNGLGAVPIKMFASEFYGYFMPPAGTFSRGAPSVIIYSANQSCFVLQSNYNSPSAFLYADGINLAVGGTGPVPSAGENCVYFGTNITSTGIWGALAVGNTIAMGSGYGSAAVGNNITANNGVGPNYAVAVGENIDWSNAHNSLSVGHSITNNTPHSLVVGQGITMPNTGSGGNFVVSPFNKSIPGTNNFLFGNGNISNPGSLCITDSINVVSDTAADQWNSVYNGGYRFLVGTGIIAYQIDANSNLINGFGEADQSKVILTPSSGDTITLATTNLRTIINSSGTLAALTVNMPASPIDGQLQTVTTTQIITALTVGGGGNTIIGQPTALTVGQSFTMIYDLSTTTWYPG
jgi:hypothetical protein